MGTGWTEASKDKLLMVHLKGMRLPLEIGLRRMEPPVPQVNVVLKLRVNATICMFHLLVLGLTGR